MRLVCRIHQHIHIFQADYGFGICKSSGVLEIVKKRCVLCVVLVSISSTTILVKYLELYLNFGLHNYVLHSCQGSRTCLVNTNSSSFGNPCPSLKKHLDVSYICVKGMNW